MRVGKKKILFYLPSFNAGGAERQALNLALELKNNYNMDVVLAAQYGGGPIEVECKKEGIKTLVIPFDFYYFKFITLNRLSLSGIKANFKFRAIKNNFLENISRLKLDYIFSYCYEPNVIAGYFNSYYKKTKIIWNQRDTGTPEFKKTFYENEAVSNAYRIVGNSRSSIEYVLQNYNVNQKSCVIVNGIVILEDVMKSRESLGLSNSDYVIGMVANYAISKNHVVLIKAYALLNDPNIKLLLIGRFDSAAQNLLNSFSNLKKIVYHYEGQNIVSAINLCNVIVHASLSEGMPNAVLEAMACEKLVIASNIAPHKEILGAAYPFLFDPSDAEKLKELIETTKEKNSITETYIARNETRIATDYSVECMAKLYFELINE